MPAKRTKRAASKVTALNELTLPLEKPREIVVDAARRIWLSAHSLVSSPRVTRRKSRCDGRAAR